MTDLSLPPSFSCVPLGSAPAGQRVQARGFCLAVIKEFYGTDYRPDWHADLDSLPGPAEECWFGPAQGGMFWALKGADGEIAATAGLYRLGLKPNLVSRFAQRYPQPERVTQLVRVYVRVDRRGHGLGSWLSALAEAEALRLGYETLYLHANADTAATIAFWRARGFCAFASEDGTTHFDKPLRAA